MRILHFIDSLGRGGAETALVSVAAELRRQGHVVEVLVRRAPFALAPDLEKCGVPVRRMARRHEWNLIGSARELATWVRGGRFDVVHAHLYFPMVATALMRVLAPGNARTFVTFHNLAYAGANERFVKLRFRRWLATALCRVGFDGFIAVSAAVASHYSRAFALRDISVIPNSVDCAAIRDLVGHPEPSVRTGSACEIVVPGRVVREKGHLVLLDALATLKASGIRLRLVVAGDGPLRCAVEARVHDLGLVDQVDFLGELNHQALLLAMSSADVVVIPSLFEGFGLVALEAMALGRALIVTDAGGLPGVVGSAGMVVRRAEPLALARAIQTLVDGPDLRRSLGEQALQRVSREFQVREVVGSLSAYYARARSL